MGGKASAQPTHQTVTQTSIPEEFYPYMHNVMAGAQGVASRPYEAYTGARLSDFSSDTKQSFDMNRQNAGAWMPFMEQGTNAVGAGMNATQGVLNNMPSAFNMNVNTPAIGPGVTVQSANWSTDQAKQYMNPYVNMVMDNLAKREGQAFNRDRAGIAIRAEAAGAYGGSRHGVMEQMARGQHNDRLYTLQAEQLKNAYDTGLTAFGSDRDSSVRAQMANQTNDTNLQDLRARSQLEADRIRAQVGMAGADHNMRASELGLAGANQLSQQGGQMAGLGQAHAQMLATDSDRLRQQGLAQEQLNQASLDLGYQNFTDQRDWDKNNIAFQAGLMHGLPLGSNQSSSTTQYTNPFSQMAGAGLAAYGAYQNFNQ